MSEYVDHLNFVIDDLHKEITAERAKVAELERKVYVPGEWRCPKCSLVLIATSLNALDGTMTANNHSQECANGCGPMWRVTERDARVMARKDYCDEWDKREAAVARERALRAAIEGAPHSKICAAWKRITSWDEHGQRNVEGKLYEEWCDCWKAEALQGETK